MTTDVPDIVDLERYPISGPESHAVEALLRAGRGVAPVVAPPSRLMLVLSYDSAPGRQFGEDVRMRFFGRRRPLAA